MRTSLPKNGHQSYYTIRETAWFLGITPSNAAQAVRHGTLPTTRRRGRLVVSASVLAALLGTRTGGAG